MEHLPLGKILLYVLQKQDTTMLVVIIESIITNIVGRVPTFHSGRFFFFFFFIEYIFKFRICGLGTQTEFTELSLMLHHHGKVQSLSDNEA